MAVYVVTGVAGFIGSALARQLLAEGHTVRGIDNLSTGSLDNLQNLAGNIDIRVADILDTATVASLCAGADFVLHQAAMASVPRSVESPKQTHDCNVNGTLSVLLAARDARVRRVVYAASSSAYGNQPQALKHESMLPEPLSPYAAQKLAGEHYMQAFFSTYGMETICLRYFNIFGPRQAADSPYSGVIARFINDLLDDKRCTIFGDGSQSRDFTYVDNAVQANLLACEAPSLRVSGKIFNVGTGASYTLLALHDALCELAGIKRNVTFFPKRAGDVQHSEADIQRARLAFGYYPRVNFLEGLRKTLQWYVHMRNVAGGNLVTMFPDPAPSCAGKSNISI